MGGGRASSLLEFRRLMVAACMADSILHAPLACISCVLPLRDPMGSVGCIGTITFSSFSIIAS